MKLGFRHWYSINFISRGCRQTNLCLAQICYEWSITHHSLVKHTVQPARDRLLCWCHHYGKEQSKAMLCVRNKEAQKEGK